MGALELLVIATIIIAGAWVGYHAWQESLHNTGEAHDVEVLPMEYALNSTLDLDSKPIRNLIS